MIDSSTFAVALEKKTLFGYYEENDDGVKIPMCHCGKEGVERCSLGLFMGIFCDECNGD